MWPNFTFSFIKIKPETERGFMWRGGITQMEIPFHFNKIFIAFYFSQAPKYHLILEWNAAILSWQHRRVITMMKASVFLGGERRKRVEENENGENFLFFWFVAGGGMAFWWCFNVRTVSRYDCQICYFYAYLICLSCFPHWFWHFDGIWRVLNNIFFTQSLSISW